MFANGRESNVSPSSRDRNQPTRAGVIDRLAVVADLNPNRRSSDGALDACFRRTLRLTR